MRNLKLILQYDGSAFHGFQIQPEDRTVQGDIEAILTRLTGKPVQIQGCFIQIFRYLRTDFLLL